MNGCHTSKKTGKKNGKRIGMRKYMRWAKLFELKMNFILRHMITKYLNADIPMRTGIRVYSKMSEPQESRMVYRLSQ